MTFALLALGIVLLPDPHPVPSCRAVRQPGHGLVLPPAAMAGVGAALIVGLLGGRVGWVLAVPVGYGSHRLAGRIIRSSRVEVDRKATAFVLDLLSAALTTGLPVDAAVGAVQASLDRCGDPALTNAAEPFQLVRRLLLLGSDPVQAWAELAAVDGLRSVAAAGRRCAHSGARLGGALTEAATELRAQHRQRELARAQRTGVWALLPLGLCFLPAFVCLGVVPVVLGVAGQMFGGQLGLGGGSPLQ